MPLDEDIGGGGMALLLGDFGMADIGAVPAGGGMVLFIGGTPLVVVAGGGMVLFIGAMLLVEAAGGGIWSAGRCAPLSGWLHADKDSTKALARMIGRTSMMLPRWMGTGIIKRQA